MDHEFYDPEQEVENKKWYQEFPKASSPTKHSKSQDEVTELKAKAKRSLDGETAAYELKQSKTRKSDYTWLKTALSKGTAGDKLAAHVIIIQDSPKHNSSYLSSTISLLSSVGKVSKGNQCTSVMDALKDVFLSDLLHPEYKLLKFEEQNFDELEKQSEPEKYKKLLTYWYFEDQLKELYERFIQVLSEIATNTIDKNKEKAISTMNDLLMNNSQEEQMLLVNIVNKIGDPSSKVVSTVIFCLLKLLREHPNMKGVVLHEAEKLLFRKNIAPRVQYYVICLLTQFVLSKNDQDTATNMIEVYFAFFKATLKRSEPQSKMMAAILTGVNRAYPFAKVENLKIQDHIDSVFKVVHIGSFNVSLSALNLLFQAVGKDPKQSNRFYATFYKKLMDPQIASVNKPAVFLNLVYRALCNDPSAMRVAAFIKRMLQVSMYFPANMTCAFLYTMSQILKTKSDVKRIINRSQVQMKSEIKEEPVISLDEFLNETSASVEVEDDHSDTEHKDSIVLSNVTVEPIAEVNSEVKNEEIVKIEEDKTKPYDPFHWNPLYAGAYNASFTELNTLTSHFHPTVALFANNIIEGNIIEYTGDPLEDLTLTRFLERYVYKNPKKLSEQDRVKKSTPISKRSVYDPKGLKKIAVDSAAYLNERRDRIPVDELFLHNYLTKRREIRGVKSEDENDDDDVESVNSDDFNTMLDGLGTKQGFEDIDDMDIATEFADSAKKKKKSKKDDSHEESAEDEELDEEMEDSDDDFGSDDENEDLEGFDDQEDLEDLSDLDMDGIDDDASEIDFNDEDEEIENTKDKGKNKSNENVFMSAEKFAEMLESQGSSKMKQGSSNTMSDADGSNFKQVKWEMDRNHKLSRSKFNKSKKRPQHFKGNKSNKKQKR